MKKNCKICGKTFREKKDGQGICEECLIKLYLDNKEKGRSKKNK